MSATEDGRLILDTKMADRSVWLMKCPPVVSRSWKSAADNASTSASDSIASNPVVAKVVLFVDPLSTDDSSAPQFKLELAHSGVSNTPKSYSLNMHKDFVPMCCFSESKKGEFSLEGKVEHKFDMEPHSENYGAYSKLCRERTKKANLKTRQTQVYENDNGLRMRPLPGMVSSFSTSKDKKKAVQAKGSDAKRTRRDRQELESIIFRLFETQPNWSLKQLILKTDQPEQFLKEILNDLCVYNKRGPNQGTHELKPEYKKSTDEMDTTS